RLHVPARYRHIVFGLAAAFAAEAEALRALAHADVGDNQTRYEKASHEIENADLRLKAASGRAVVAGLLNATIARLAVPAWPMAVTSGTVTTTSLSSATSTTLTTSFSATYVPSSTTQSTAPPTVRTTQTTHATTPAHPIHG